MLDNLKRGVILSDLYEPAINPVYAAMLALTALSPTRRAMGMPIARVRLNRLSNIRSPPRSRAAASSLWRIKSPGLPTGRSAGRRRASTGATSAKCGTVLRRHPRSSEPGHFELPDADRIFNPSRETARIIGKISKIVPHSGKLARKIFARLGRPGHKAICGMSNLPRRRHASEQRVLARVNELEGGELEHITSLDFPSIVRKPIKSDPEYRKTG